MGSKQKISSIFYKTFSAIILLFLGVVIFFYAPNPLKVTDPSDPRFDPYSFKYKDYDGGLCSMREVYRSIFEVGDTKTFVDDVLVKSGGAKLEISKDGWHAYGPNVFIPYFSYTLFIGYDEQETLTDAKMNAVSIYAPN